VKVFSSETPFCVDGDIFAWFLMSNSDTSVTWLTRESQSLFGFRRVPGQARQASGFAGLVRSPEKRSIYL
jgi:hypothetical protein